MKTSLAILLLILNAGGVLFGRHPGNSLRQQSEKILEIDYDHGGGDAGYSLILKITRDSILYNATTDYTDSRERFTRVIKKQRNDQENWLKLIGTINLTAFDKIMTGPNLRRNDGNDVQLMIRTSKKNHFLVVDKNNYLQVKSIMDMLQATVGRFSKKAKIFN